MNKLTKKQKAIQVQREIKNHYKNIVEPKMFRDTENLINDLDKKSEFLEHDNDSIKNHVIGENIRD